MLKKITMLMIVMVFAAAAAYAAPAEVPRTGQVASYGTGTSDDGALQRGIAWPNPRFTVASSGTGTAVTDNLTGLIWAADPTLSPLCSGGTTTTWQGALDYVVCLNANTYLGHTDWRLPNKRELRSLADYSQISPALPSGHPFSNVQANHNQYWSSTTYATNTADAWAVDMTDGWVGVPLKTSSHYVWPVRSGQ
jgi:hypothetical protein